MKQFHNILNIISNISCIFYIIVASFTHNRVDATYYLGWAILSRLLADIKYED